MNLQPTLRKLLKSLILAGSALVSTAFAGQINWDPSAIGLAGSGAFTADALKATEVSHIVFAGPNFSEHGFAKVTGVRNGALLSTPTGLNSSYTLYFDFTITGSLITSQFDTFDFALYGVDGASNFGIDGSNNAFVNNGAHSAILLATNSLISGSVAGGPGSDLSAQSLSLFSATAAGAPVFLAPNLPAIFQGSYFHSIQEPGGITQAPDGSIVINGGDDTLNFTPEPASIVLLLSALPALLFFRRRP